MWPHVAQKTLVSIFKLFNFRYIVRCAVGAFTLEQKAVDLFLDYSGWMLIPGQSKVLVKDFKMRNLYRQGFYTYHYHL